MDSNLIDPKAIAQTCSRKHIQSVIENLVDIIKAQEHLADKVLFLNPRCGEIGEGMLTHLQSLAYDIVNKRHHKVQYSPHFNKHVLISGYLDYRRTIDTCLYNENVAKELSKKKLLQLL